MWDWLEDDLAPWLGIAVIILGGFGPAVASWVVVDRTCNSLWVFGILFFGGVGVVGCVLAWKRSA